MAPTPSAPIATFIRTSGRTEGMHRKRNCSCKVEGNEQKNLPSDEDSLHQHCLRELPGLSCASPLPERSSITTGSWLGASCRPVCHTCPAFPTHLPEPETVRKMSEEDNDKEEVNGATWQCENLMMQIPSDSEYYSYVKQIGVLPKKTAILFFPSSEGSHRVKLRSQHEFNAKIEILEVNLPPKSVFMHDSMQHTQIYIVLAAILMPVSRKNGDSTKMGSLFIGTPHY